ncbi:MAG: histidine phosphatase family protein, partial [Alphaproteobacteria bacterium]|nr:histidine phosphatase family protein [Alphaproteobacteria bacterium]
GDPAAAPHGGESVLDLVQQVASWLEGQAPKGQAGASGHTIAVTHPAIIRAAAIHVLAADVRSFWRIDIEPLTATRLTRNNRVWTLRTLGGALAAD